MEEALTQYLLAEEAGLTPIIGDRLTWTLRDQGAPLPAVVLTVISRVPVDADEGELGLTEARLQADVYGRDQDEALTIGRKLRARLSGAELEVGGVEFGGTWLEDERHSAERISGEETAFRVSQDFQIWASS